VSARRVLVVAGSPVVRAGLESLLARTSDYAVIGAATLPSLSGDGGVSEPDVIVLALDPEREAGLAQVLGVDPGAALPALVVIGDEPVGDWGPRALRLGARAVLPQSTGAAELVAAIEAVASGLVALPPELVGSFTATTPRPAEAVPQPLTAREVEVLALLAAGLGNKTIAGRLHISEHTVKSHVTSLFGKLAVSTRAEAVAVAVRQGLLML
jgi:two-component system, NarL family, response regulator YdfI